MLTLTGQAKVDLNKNSNFRNFLFFSFQKWLAENMGQVDSKRPMPSIQVQSPHTAHLPEKPRTPTPSKALLNVPTNR